MIERPIDAPRALLWSYLSTAGGLSCWQADRVEGGLDEGSFSLRWPQLGARLDLSVAEMEHQRSLVLRAGENVLNMKLSDGGVLLRHSGLHEEDDLEGLSSSWHAALSLLQIAATSHPRKTRAVHWLFQPIQASAELAHYYFTDVRALESWLGTADRTLQTHQTFRIDCDGQALTGTVMWGERDVCLRVHELENGALTFRTLPAPEQQRVVAVGVSSWTQKAVDAELLTRLEGSLSRLARIVQKRQS